MTIDLLLERIYDDVMKHLGQPVVYTTAAGVHTPIIAYIHEPDNSYDVGETEVDNQIIIAAVKAAEITPQRGDYVSIKGRKYKIFTIPRLEPSTNLWRFSGVLESGEENDE